jgi:hypothetical protein
MAGGGIGVPTSTTNKPAAPTPAGSPLDGSPKFEAAAPVADASTAAAAAGTSPSTLPATAPGTPFAGLPPWLSMWSGASFGASTPSSGNPFGGYAPFVPGTALSGYGGPRAPTVYQPPAKPVTAEDPAAKKPTGFPEYYDFDSAPFWEYGMFRTGQKAPTADQIAMKKWLDQDARNRAIAASMAAQQSGAGA